MTRIALTTILVWLAVAAKSIAAQSGFIENVGQWKSPAEYVAVLPGMVVHLRAGELWIVQLTAGGERQISRVWFDGLSGVREVARDVLGGQYNYFYGTDPALWRRGVRSFSRIECVSETSGVTISFWIERHRLFFEANDQAGDGKAREISIQFEPIHGSVGLDLLEDGRSEALAASMWGGSRLSLGRVHSLGIAGDDAQPTVEAGGLAWSSFFGGSLTEEIDDVVVHDDGRITMVGNTHSPDLPVSRTAIDPEFNPGAGTNARDAFVCQFSPAGELLFGTFLGGVETAGDYALAVAASATGQVTVAGRTFSQSFPTTPGAFQTTKSGLADAFVARLSNDGSRLEFSTLLGGTGNLDRIRRLELAPGGDAIFAGQTNAGFPTTAGAFQVTAPTTGNIYPFVTRLAASGDRLVYSTYVTGDTGGLVYGLSVGPDESALIVGTTGQDFPSTPGAIQGLSGGETNTPFITRLSPDGSSLIFSGSIGGTKADRVTAVDHDAWGNIVLAGHTFSSDFQVTPDAYDLTGPQGSLDGEDGFVAVLDPHGTTIRYASYLGASFADSPQDVLVDGSGAIVVAGTTTGFDYPVTPGAFDEIHNTGVKTDLFVTRFSPDRLRVEYSTFLGGSEGEGGNGGARVALGEDVAGGVVIASDTRSPDYPVTEGAFQTTLQLQDAVVSKLELLPTGASRYGRSTPGCEGPLVISVTKKPQLGSRDFAVTCTRAPPISQLGFLVVSMGSLDVPVSLLGAQAWVDPERIARLLLLRSDRLGYAEAEIPLMHDPGVPLYLQAFWRDTCAPAGWSATAGLVLDIQP